MTVKFQSQNDSESRAQRRGKQSGPSGRAHKRERLHIHGVGSRGGALANQDVELVIFERRIQDFFERRLQPVDFINK